MNRTRRIRCASVGVFLIGVILLLLAMPGCKESPDAITAESATGASQGLAKAANGVIGINIVLSVSVTDAIVMDLGSFGTLLDVYREINALRILGKAEAIPAIRALPYVKAAGPDAERDGPPIDAVAVTNFAAGLSIWDLDAVNVTDFGFDNRAVAYDGAGVFIGILDTGLLDSWRQYFPQERIAVQYARAFAGGGVSGNSTSEQPNKWEHDQDSHGTHVTSTILGYSLSGTPINGVAPNATVIPVKVLNQNGSGWSSVIARGILYVAELKVGPLAGSPVVINMSLGGPRPDPLELAAIDYAIGKGVIVVASAGNRGSAGMGYPGGYAPVISVAASGWTGEWVGGSSWWYAKNVPDPTNPLQYYIADYSSRALAGQDLDVAAPGTWIVGPYQFNSGHTSYYFLGGTSMACPHVAGIVALMAQKNPALTAAQAESILESSAVPLAPGSRTIHNPDGSTSAVSWGADAAGAGLAVADAALAATP